MDNTVILAFVTGIIVLVSYALDKKKTILGLKKGGRMLFNILHPFLNVLILISIVFFFIPDSVIVRYLGADSGWFGFGLAAIIGSITLIPGPISYPLAAVLLKQGATYGIVAVFITTLIMVGVVTLPLEIQYFGKKAALLRNGLNFIAAIIIGILIGWLM